MYTFLQILRVGHGWGRPAGWVESGRGCLIVNNWPYFAVVSCYRVTCVTEAPSVTKIFVILKQCLLKNLSWVGSGKIFVLGVDRVGDGRYKSVGWVV